ncbi:MAG: phospho-N-acetylmuramoyl-pentapeptide-transferase, partial [Eubacterium sp.]|nr:phospho-N-acetylmuramoyl-pentapeptide-transferase [Eubacterium sp.]
MNMSVVILISVVIAFGITAALGFVIIPWLRKLKFGQTILDIGPSWHKSKQGTPNMGGLMFIIGIVISVIVSAGIFVAQGESLETDFSAMVKNRENILIAASVLLAVGCGIVGFLDDFIKIRFKRNKGLSAKQKSIGQMLITIAYVAVLWISHNTVWYVPFIGTVNFEQNFLTAVIFWIISIVIIYGCTNSVNLSDEIAGLCKSVKVTF